MMTQPFVIFDKDWEAFLEKQHLPKPCPSSTASIEEQPVSEHSLENHCFPAFKLRQDRGNQDSEPPHVSTWRIA